MTAPDVSFRIATSVDVPAMVACHVTDDGVIPYDPRMASYLDGKSHPQQALPERVGYVATIDDAVVGYVAGHLTTRNDCAGEIQLLFVSPACRRKGIGTMLLGLLAAWFKKQDARRVCVPIANDSAPEAKPFVEHAGASPLRRHWHGWEDIGVLVGKET
jgi:GNAT superfamily N-acetyltransferase